MEERPICPDCLQEKDKKVGLIKLLKFIPAHPDWQCPECGRRYYNFQLREEISTQKTS